MAISSGQRGLTLVELLIAISILSLIAVLGWRGLDSIVRARIALTSDLEQTRGMQLAFAQLQSDCAHLAADLTLPDPMPLAAERGRLMLVRTVFAENQPSQLQVVTYRLRDEVLIRSESAATRDLSELRILWQAAAIDTVTSQEVALQSGIAEMTLRQWFSGSVAWQNAESVRPATIPAATAGSPAGVWHISRPPTGLEVSLQLRGQKNRMIKVFLLGVV